MKLASKVALLGALMLPMAAAPAMAQSWKWDFSLGGGYSWYRAFLDSENAPTLADGDEEKFGSAPFLGAQLTFWPSSRIGIRLNGTYADTDIEGLDSEIDGDDVSFLENVNLWSGTGDLMFRFTRPDDEYTGMEILPYLALGAGLKWMNPAGDAETCVDTEESESFNCAS